MKISITIFMLALIGWSNLATAQAPDWDWAKSAGGTNADYALNISTDANGNVLMVGHFYSPTITFGSTILTNVGVSDVFIVKYDLSGNVLWAKSAGSTGSDFGYSVSSDPSGNIIITGVFRGPSITFGTTALTNTSVPYYDIFIVKYDPNGNVMWAKRAGASYDDTGQSVSADAYGNIYLAGNFSGPTIVFGSITLVGGSDIFIVKYDSIGNVLWAKKAGGNQDENVFSITAGSNGGVILAGYTQSSNINFGTTSLTNPGNFIVKYDANGNDIWAKSAGLVLLRSVSSDASGNIYSAGWFDSPTITFGSSTLINLGLWDIFLLKYDANGNELWAKSAGGIGYDESAGVTNDVNGNVFITGYFRSPTITFGNTTLTNTGVGEDVFIAKYDANGNVLWAKSTGGTSADRGNSITTDASGNAFIAGSFASPTITFGPILLTNVNAGNNDMFIAKINSSTTGINEIAPNADIAIAPNPFTIQTSIIFNAEQKNTTIKITDVLGNEIRSTSFSGKQYVIEKGEMKSGVYFLQTIDEKKNVVNKKIVVQ